VVGRQESLLVQELDVHLVLLQVYCMRC